MKGNLASGKGLFWDKLVFKHIGVWKDGSQLNSEPLKHVFNDFGVPITYEDLISNDFTAEELKAQEAEKIKQDKKSLATSQAKVFYQYLLKAPKWDSYGADKDFTSNIKKYYETKAIGGDSIILNKEANQKIVELPTITHWEKLKQQLERDYSMSIKDAGGLIIIKGIHEKEGSSTYIDLWLLTDILGEEYAQLLKYNNTTPEAGIYWENVG